MAATLLERNANSSRLLNSGTTDKLKTSFEYATAIGSFILQTRCICLEYGKDLLEALKDQ